MEARARIKETELIYILLERKNLKKKSLPETEKIRGGTAVDHCFGFLCHTPKSARERN